MLCLATEIKKDMEKITMKFWTLLELAKELIINAD